MRFPAASSVAWGFCTLADRSATTIRDWAEGVVCSSKPASAPVSSTTIKARRPSETRARRGASGGDNRFQMTAIAASARIPAPTKRGRVRSKPTMKGKPFQDDQAERAQGNPRPDLELAAMEAVDGDRAVDRRKRDAVGRRELRDLVRE